MRDATMHRTELKLSELVSDNAFQPRLGLDDDHVEAMVEALNHNLMTFDNDPIHVWVIEGQYLIIDGHHRFAAFSRKSDCIVAVPVIVHETVQNDGESVEEHTRRSRADALQKAITANNHHGSPLKRSRADNRRAIELLLDDPMNRQLSDSAIASLVGVTSATVGNVRKSKPEYQVDQRLTTDGRVVSRNRQASGAGKRKRPEQTPEREVETVTPTVNHRQIKREFVPLSSNVTSVSVVSFDGEPANQADELTIEERRQKFLDELSFEPEELLDTDSDCLNRSPKDDRGKTIPVQFPYSSDEDFSWIPDRKLCSGVLDGRIHENVKFLIVELVRRFLKRSDLCEPGTPTVEPDELPVESSSVEAVEADDSTFALKPSSNAKTRFNWATHEGILDSMRHVKFTTGVQRFREWRQRCKVSDKRTRFPDVPDDATLERWWDDLSA
jgi:hypothetical protein